jgi:hypothetical protein
MRLSFDDPEERRTLADGRVAVDVVRMAGMPVLRITHNVGWRWSRDSVPGDSSVDRCQSVHVGVMTAGELGVEEADGRTYVLRAGDPVAISPGHDAWTVGPEAAVFVQFDEGDSAQRRFGLS